MPADRWTSAVAFLNVSDPLVAWLVYRGEIVSAPNVHQSALSFWSAGYLAAVRQGQRLARFNVELALEDVRRRNHPAAVSRLQGFYVFEDEETALRASTTWDGRGFQRDHLADIAIRPDARTSRYDAEWITRGLDAGADVADWADRYFGGEPSGPEPIWETLVDGRARVLGTSLRERAYETVKHAWPASLPLLELARVGAELDSDLGLIAALVFDDGRERAVRYAMNFADATNDEFLRRIAAFDGPKNTTDLSSESDLVRPDLRNRGFSL